LLILTWMQDANALYYTDRAEHCRREAALLRQELAEEQTRSRFEEAQALATTILQLDGLSGAEIEAAERIIYGTSCPIADLARLRAIALNHSVLITN
jgi:hypothetical protein